MSQEFPSSAKVYDIAWP